MEQTELLFIDVEWNQIKDQMECESSEMLQIAAIGFTKRYSGKRKYTRTIRPKHIEKIKACTYKLLKMSPKTLEEAVPMEQVMNEFYQKFPKFQVVIVWSRDAYELLKYNSSAYGYKMPRHRVVVLQELLQDIRPKGKKKMGFQKALHAAGIPHDVKLLHCAKHDVKYLQQLYRAIFQKYEEICEIDRECYSSKKSKVVHNAGCRYAKLIAEHNLVKKQRTEVFYGTNICKCCNQQEGFRTFSWKKVVRKNPKNMKPSFEDDYIFAVCEYCGVKCQIGKGVIFINTGMTTWRIYHDEEKVVGVYHENYRVKKEDYLKKKKWKEGYHRQQVREDTLYEVVRYIQKHDSHFGEIRKNSRIDMLFEQLERERKAKEGIL